MDKKDPETGRLKHDFNDLLEKSIHYGDNFLSRPLGVGEGNIPSKSGKGTKVSPSVQMKLSVVDLEMARLSHEVNILGSLRARIRSVKANLATEYKLISQKENDIELFLKYLKDNKEYVRQMLLREDMRLSSVSGSVKNDLD